MSGGEVPKHRALLGKMQADRIAVNLASVVKDRSGGMGDEDTLLPFDKLFYTSQNDLEPSDYDKVLERYLDDSSLVLGIESEVAVKRGVYVPEWLGGDVEELFELAVEYGNIAINEGVLVTDSLIKPITLFRARNPHVRLFTSCSKPKLLDPKVLTDVLVSGWISSQRHRELQVWDGRKVARFPSAKRLTALSEHRAQVINLGFDPQLIEEGDVPETMALAVKSWLQYENVATILPSPAELNEQNEPNTLAIQPRSGREREELVQLPVLAPIRTGEERSLPAARTLRQCDICSLNSVCPKYEQHAACAFEIPVTLRTKSDVEHMMSTMIEIQGQRALMAKFEEDLLSQGVTQEASSEIERFFRLLEASKRISAEYAQLTVTATASGGAGPLSALFGDRVGQVNQELPKPVPSDEVIEDAEIIDSN